VGLAAAELKTAKTEVDRRSGCGAPLVEQARQGLLL